MQNLVKRGWFHECFETCYEDLGKRRCTFFTLDPVRGTPLTRALPKRNAFLLGQEAFGVMREYLRQHPLVTI